MTRYLFLLLPIILAGCSSEKNILEKIQSEGELRVITRNNPTTFYEGPDGPAGIEYELIKRFSAYIGVKPRFILPETFQETIPAIESGQAHIAAAGLTITEERKQRVRFSTPYQTITSQVVYLSGNRRPREVENLVGKKLAVLAGSSHEELLKKFKLEHPQLRWKSTINTTLELFFQDIVNGSIDFAVGDSNNVAINRRYYPKINVAFDLSEPEHLAWALPHSQDDSLYNKTIDFFEKITESGELEQLLEQYYGHVEKLNFVDKRTFWRHTEERLPKYQSYFEAAAKLSGYDWRLLAAIGYQESHWNPKATSPTGVRGIMMLTRATAKQLGIKNRLSPEKSILGGARYLKKVEKKIPKRIPPPDRTWMALAAYNVGFGHLEDARILTERKGKNPDKWTDVKKNLPELSKPKVYKTLKHGYARGQEPVNYVDNIRNFYDLLLWRDRQNKTGKENFFIKMPEAL